MTDEQKISRAEHMDLMRENEKLLKLISDIEESLTADNTYRLLREACRTALSNAGFDAAVIREGMGQ